MTQACRTAANYDSRSDWTNGAEIELNTALALARASTQALLQLSPLSHREITTALTEEIDRLQGQGDAVSLATAEAIRPLLAEAA